MKRKQAAAGLTIDQIDTITLEICYAEALSAALMDDAPEGQDPSLFHLLQRQLTKVKDMVLDTQIGRSHG